MQRQIMDSLDRQPRRPSASSRATSRRDLYNIQQQLVQLQELTGQSQQRLSELRTQLEARGAQIETTAPPGGAPAPGDTAQPTRRRRRPPPTRCTRRRWRSSGAAAPAPRGSGCARCCGTIPTSPRAPDALYFIGQSFAAENPDSAAAYYTQVVDKYRHVRPGPVGPVQPGPAGRAAEGQRQGQGRLPARGAEVSPVGRGRAGPRSPEGARALSPGVAVA